MYFYYEAIEKVSTALAARRHEKYLEGANDTRIDIDSAAISIAIIYGERFSDVKDILESKIKTKYYSRYFEGE